MILRKVVLGQLRRRRRRASLAKAAMRNAALGPHEKTLGTSFTVAGIVRKHQSRMSDAFWLKACTDAVATAIPSTTYFAAVAASASVDVAFVNAF